VAIEKPSLSLPKLQIRQRYQSPPVFFVFIIQGLELIQQQLLFSEGDILRAALPDIDEILEEGGTLDDAYQVFLRRGAELSHRPIAPLIIREPITLLPEDHVAKASAILVSRQIRLLPVVKDGRLLGTVSRANICQAVVGTL
jgi:CBS domain-containing protein